LAISYRARIRSVRRTCGELADFAESWSARPHSRRLPSLVWALSYRAWITRAAGGAAGAAGGGGAPDDRRAEPEPGLEEADHRHPP
jgi:hypothetical protein